jgi:hypothetical protein
MAEPPSTRVFFLPTGGPVHWMLAGAGWGQAWCGARPQFRHTIRFATAEAVTCTTCLRRMALGRPQSRGR